MGMTYVQKLLARACGRAEVAVGEVLEPPVDLAMSHENAALVVNPFDTVGLAKALDQALTMPREERRSRHADMIRIMRENSLDRWRDRTPTLKA